MLFRSIHLWEFLLNLLLDEKSDHMICWTNREAGEFKLKNQEEVARRWGNLKHRPGMNYDKLSRALRYYYQKGIIKKVMFFIINRNYQLLAVLISSILIQFLRPCLFSFFLREQTQIFSSSCNPF